MTSPIFAHHAMCGQGRLHRNWRAVGKESSGVVFGKREKLLRFFRTNEIVRAIFPKNEIVPVTLEIVPSLEIVLDSSGPFQ